MNKIYVFDMDGTLTPPRKPMEEQFAELFLPWLKKHLAYLVTGSDLQKVQEQLPSDIMGGFQGIFASSGNLLWSVGNTVYSRDCDHDPKLIDALEMLRKNTSYPGTLYPNYKEVRTGMINFSVLGRDAPYEEREKYSAWDAENHERERIQKELSERFAEYDITIGGQISIDIVKKGYGKNQIAQEIMAINPDCQIAFFGDKTFKGGNDHALACELKKYPGTEVVQVDGPDELLKILDIK